MANTPRQPQVVRTERQHELIRNRLKEYRDLHLVGPRKLSWRGIGDEIFQRTEVRVRSEVVRKWVKKFIEQNRQTPVRINVEEVEAIISFLIKIGMLLPEELVDPKPPYLLLHSFQQLLRINSKHIPESPYWLDGLYEAWHRVDNTDQMEEIWIKTILRLEVDCSNRHVHAMETCETHIREPGETSVLSGGLPNEGWGIVTPEGNLFLFMKTQPYSHNYYYLTLAARWTQLAMLRHEFPADADPTAETFEELIKATRQHTLILHFNRVNEDRGE